MAELRWEKLSAALRQRGTAEQWFADARSGRFTVKRGSYQRRWSAEFVGRDIDGREVRFSRGLLPTLGHAQRWCAAANEWGKDHAMSMSEDVI